MYNRCAINVCLNKNEAAQTPIQSVNHLFDILDLLSPWLKSKSFPHQLAHDMCVGALWPGLWDCRGWDLAGVVPWSCAGSQCLLERVYSLLSACPTDNRIVPITSSM